MLSELGSMKGEQRVGCVNFVIVNERTSVVTGFSAPRSSSYEERLVLGHAGFPTMFSFTVLEH